MTLDDSLAGDLACIAGKLDDLEDALYDVDELAGGELDDARETLTEARQDLMNAGVELLMRDEDIAEKAASLGDDELLVHGLKCKECGHAHEPTDWEAEWGNPEEDTCPECEQVTPHEVTA